MTLFTRVLSPDGWFNRYKKVASGGSKEPPLAFLCAEGEKKPPAELVEYPVRGEQGRVQAYLLMHDAITAVSVQRGAGLAGDRAPQKADPAVRRCPPSGRAKGMGCRRSHLSGAEKSRE